MAHAANDAMQAIYEGDWSRAEQLAREAVQTDPDDADYLLPLAIALQMQRRWEEALEVIERGIEQLENSSGPPEFPEISLGTLQNQRRWLEAVAESRSDSVDLLHRLPPGWGDPMRLLAMKERACFALDMSEPAQTSAAWSHSALSAQMNLPSGLDSGAGDPVAATAITKEETARLQATIPESSPQGHEEFYCVLSSVVPGDARRGLVQSAVALLDSEYRTSHLWNEHDFYPYYEMFRIISVDAGCSQVDSLIERSCEIYNQEFDDIGQRVEDFARIIYEVFTTVDLGLSGVPESESAAHNHGHVDKQWTEAVIGVRDGSEGICISLCHYRHDLSETGPLMLLEGPVANLIKQARGWSDDDPISIGLEDAEGELRVIVETLRPLLELWRSDPALAYVMVTSPANSEETYDLTMQGFDLVYRRQSEEALCCFDRAIEIDPEAGGAWYGRGVALILLDRDEEGRKSLDRALEVYPGLADAWADKGEALFNAGLFEEVEESSTFTLLIAPHHDDGLALWDLLRAVRGEHPEGREILQEYADQLCKNALECLGCRQFAAGSDYAARALKLVPDHLEALRMHGVLLKIQDDAEGALTQYDQIITLDPDNARGHFDRGQILVELRRYEEAIEAFEKAASLGHEHAREDLERLRERKS